MQRLKLTSKEKCGWNKEQALEHVDYEEYISVLITKYARD